MNVEVVVLRRGHQPSMGKYEIPNETPVDVMRRVRSFLTDLSPQEQEEILRNIKWGR